MNGLQAIVFDFDGVIADSEPLHLRTFQEALRSEGVDLIPADYYARYLGYDDVQAFRAVARDRHLAWSEERITALVARKGVLMQDAMRRNSVLFPGALEFIRAAASTVPLAIASGAMRHEIDEVAIPAGIADLFTTIVAAGDSLEGKPSPAPYALACHQLQERTGMPVDPRRCVAIEDSRWGLESARGAGLRCVGLTTSYPAHELRGAELIAAGLHALSLDELDRMCRAQAASDARIPWP